MRTPANAPPQPWSDLVNDQAELAPRIALVALGGNLASNAGTPADTLQAAMEQLVLRFGAEVVCSPLYRNPAFPVGSGPDYVNAAARVPIGAGQDAAGGGTLRRPVALLATEGFRISGLRQRLGIDGGKIGIDAGEDVIGTDRVFERGRRLRAILGMGGGCQQQRNSREGSETTEHQMEPFLRPATKSRSQPRMSRLPPIGVR